MTLLVCDSVSLLEVARGTSVDGGFLDMGWAEGVQTQSVLNRVRALGCDAAQGFLLHRPAPTEQVTAVLAGGRVAPEGASAL